MKRLLIILIGLIISINTSFAATYDPEVQRIRLDEGETPTQEEVETDEDEVTSNDKKADEKEVDLTDYTAKIQYDISSNWVAPNESKDKIAIVNFKIGKQGELISCYIIRTSGSLELDNSALDAVRKTAPFTPIPDGYKDDNIEINYRFDYKILK